MAFDTRPRLLAALRDLASRQPAESITHKQLAAATGLSLPTVQKHLGAAENFAALLNFEAEHHDTAATRERVMGAAAAVFADKGYTGASLDMVARAAGMTKGAIYWNFASKAELFCALLEQRCQMDDAAMEPMLQPEQMKTLDLQQAQDVIEHAVRQMSHDPRWPRLFIEFVSQAREPEIAERLALLYRQSYEKTAALNERLKEMERVHPSFDSTMVAKFWMAIIDGLLLAWMVNPNDTDLPRLAREFTRIAWQGLRPIPTGESS